MNIRLDSTDKSIKVVAQEPIIKVEQVTTDINIGVTGVRGPQGDKGDKGDAGDISDLNAGLNIEITEPVAGEVSVATVDDPSFGGVHFDTVTPITIANAGDIAWNSVDGTLDVKLLNDVTLQTGQELHFYGKASGAISNGDLCQFAGVQGDHILMKKVVASEVIANHDLLIGVATTNIANGDFGYVTWFGKVNNVYTTGWTAGDLLYMDNSTGQLTKTAPVPPQHKITVAVVIKLATGAAENGIILVRPTHSYQISELEDTDIDTPLDNQVLQYNSTSGNWENATLVISDTNGLQTALDSKVDENIAITGATKTKITYDAKGLVTSGADATTADISDSLNKRYVTDADLTTLSNTSGTNTGDNATNTQYSGLDAAKVNRAGDTMSGNLNMGTNKLIGGTGVADVLKLQGTTGNGTAGSAAIQLLTGDNGVIMALTVLNNGNVGIGTSTPVSKLTVNSGSTDGLMMTYDSAGNYRNSLSNEFVAGTPASNKLKLNVSDGTTSGQVTAMTLLGNGNVGIGTTTPSTKLHVTGIVRAVNDSFAAGDGSFQAHGQNPSIIQRIQRASGGFAAQLTQATAENTTTTLSTLLVDYGVYGALNSGVTPPDLAYAYFSVGSTAAYNATNLRLYNNADKVVSVDGKLGVGTTSPNSKLQIDTGVATTIGQIIKGAASQTADLLQLQNSTGSILTKITSAGNLLLPDGSSLVPSVSFASDTDTGFYRLATNYFAASAGGVTVATFKNDGGQKGAVLYGNTYNGTVANAILTLSTNSSILATHSIDQTNKKYLIQPYENGVSYNVDTILNSLGGNVGIGTTTPNYLLDVKGAIGLTSGSYYREFATPTNFGYAVTYKAIMLGSASTVQQAGNGAVTLSFGYDPSINANGSFTGNGGEIIFRNGMRFITPNSTNDGWNLNTLILKDGNVGIGTTSPARKLTVQDSSPLRLGTSTDYFDYTQRNTNVWGWLSNSGVYALTLNGASGRVGVNSTGAINSQLEVVASSSTTVGQIIKGASAQTADLLQIQNSAAAVLFDVTAAGRVGIGTANPSILLHVRGALYSASFPANVEIEDSAAMAQDVGGGFVFSGNDGTTGGRWWAGIRGAKENATSGNYAGYVSILTRTSGVASMTERMRVSSAGNVGIGTTAPSEKLDVSGTVKATGYKSSDGSAGVSGSFTTTDGKSITIKDGLVTSIV